MPQEPNGSRHSSQPRQLEMEFARRTVSAGAAFCAVAAAIYAAVNAVLGPVEFVLPHIVASALLAGIAMIRASNPVLMLYPAITVGLVLFGYQLLLIGHIDNSVVVWFLVPNVATMLLGLRKLAIYCGTITAAEIVGIVVAARSGWLPERVVLHEKDAVMALSIFSVIALCGLFAHTALRTRHQLIKEAALRNEALERALEGTRLARNEALEASRSKERFFANLTHEIRTPLTGIAGTAEMLRQTALSGEQQPLAKALAVSTQNLTDLVNAMLDYAKMAAGGVTVEVTSVHLGGFMQELRDLFAARALDKRLAFDVASTGAAPDWIDIDAVKLKQIVNNLVSNAIKFTPAGAVSVRWHCLSPEDRPAELRLVVTVSDTGIGIAPEQIHMVFEPFVQGDMSISRAFGGTGLGLAIARQLTQLMGGTLSVQSKVGKGSTFTVELPVRPAAAPQPAAPEPRPASQEAGFTGLRVLLVEDNPINQLVACAMLKTLQIEVDVAENGMEAVKMVAGGNFQAILMDLQMPGMDGIAATHAIRRFEEERGARRVPIFAMTGNSPEDYGRACVQAGMNGFIVKPMKMEQLRAIIATLGAPH